MFSLKSGLSPNACRAGYARLALSIAALILGSALSVTAASEESTPLALDAAVQLALAHEPGQAALVERGNALEEQAIAAGQLADPKLRVGLGNFPLESGGFRTEGMTQAQLGFRQAFPAGKTRAAMTRQFRSLALEMNESAGARVRDVQTAVRIAWLDAWYQARAKEIVTGSRPFFGDLVAVSRSLYSVGRNDQQDVLRAELELSRLDDRLIGIDKQQAHARAALSEWVGDASTRPLPTRLPQFDALPPIADLRMALDAHPVIRAANARIDAKEAGVDAARQKYKPGWALDVGYGYRDGRLPDGSSRSDFISVGVTVDLPFFRRNRQDRTLAAALSESRAAGESKEQLLRRLHSQLDAEYARWQELSRRIDLFEQRILGQAREQRRAALSAYRSDTGDFADVMRSAIDEFNTRLDYVRLTVERAQSHAVLANLGGLSR